MAVTGCACQSNRGGDDVEDDPRRQVYMPYGTYKFYKIFKNSLKNQEFFIPLKFQGIRIFRIWTTCVQHLNGLLWLDLEKKIFEKMLTDGQTD